MNKFSLAFALFALGSTTAALAIQTPAAMPSAAPVTAEVGKMLYSTGGKKLAAVYKIAANGSPQILIDGRIITVPASTLSETDGRTETSLTKKDIFTMR